MKTRTSLVSNSSSSSFIVHRTLLYTAKAMWKCATSDWEAKYRKWIPRHLKEIEKTCKREDVLSGKIGISFPSTNEDTYILFKDKVCYVQTCANHNWHDFVDGIGISSDYIEKVEKKLATAKFYYHIGPKKLFTRKQFSIPKRLRKKLVCRLCKEEAAKNGWTHVNMDYYIRDEKDNKYCYFHHQKLQELTNETPKE